MSTAAAKKITPKKKATARGGKRDNAGRQAPDGATSIITTSIGLMQHHREFLSDQPGGPSVWVRKVIDATIAAKKRKEAK